MINQEYYYSCKYLSKNLSSFGTLSNTINLFHKDEIVKSVEKATQKNFVEILDNLKESGIIKTEKDWEYNS